MTTEPCWAIIDRCTGKLVLFDGRVPVYWRLRVAREAAWERGFTPIGKYADVVIQRVSVRPRKVQ